MNFNFKKNKSNEKSVLDSGMRFIVYLAGPISGLSFDNSIGWREEIMKMFPKEIIGMSPMRGKKYLEGMEDISGSYDNSHHLGEIATVLSSSRGITSRDHNDCQRSDLIIVNFLDYPKVSIGTVMEIAWAYAYKIPLIVISEEENIHNHPMIKEATDFRVKTLAQAVTVATSVLLPVPHR